MLRTSFYSYKKYSALTRYLFAIGIFLIALALRFAILPAEYGVAFLTFYPAMVICFYICGIGAGILVALLSSVAGYYFFIPPYFQFSHYSGGDIVVVTFLFSTFLIGFVIKQLQLYAEKLQLNEQKYSSILEDQTEILCRFKIDGTILYVNEAYCRLFGKKPENLISTQWHPQAFDEDVPFINEQLEKLTVDNHFVTIENRIYTVNGIRWYQFVNRAFFNAEGILIEIQGVGRDITDRKILEKQLAEASKEIEDLYNNAPCGYHSLDKNGTIVNINDTELSWLGCSRNDVIGKKFTDFVTPENKEVFKKNYPLFLANGHIENLEFDLASQDGNVRHVSVSATSIKGEDGNLIKSRSVVYDITELKATQNALHKLTHEQKIILNNALVGIMKLRNRRIVWTNTVTEKIFGYDEGELNNQSTRILYPDDEIFTFFGEQAYSTIQFDGTYRTQLELVCKNGEKIWIDISGAKLDESDVESLWVMLNISEQKKYQEEVEHIAYHDVLTGLPNRFLVLDRLQQAIAQAERSEKIVAICYLDLDGFKPVNDKFGHEAGDKLLIKLAHRMQDTIRANDTVGRLGGDEFILILNDLDEIEEYRIILQRIIDTINEPIMLTEFIEVKVGASIGMAIYPKDHHDPDTLLRYADQAMYKAKQLGRNRICIFDDLILLSH